MDDSRSITSPTLLRRISHPTRDEAAWRAFVDRYGKRIYQWCRNRRLQPVDAEDVMQNVLVVLARRISEFEYDPSQSFRGWLRRITENAISDYFRRPASQKMASGGTALFEQLNEVEARADLVNQLSEVFDLELFEQALHGVQQRVGAKRWRVWQATAQEGLPAATVAEQLNMKIATVYTARSQVQKMISEEIERLESNEPGEG